MAKVSFHTTWEKEMHFTRKSIWIDNIVPNESSQMALNTILKINSFRICIFMTWLWVSPCGCCHAEKEKPKLQRQNYSTGKPELRIIHLETVQSYDKAEKSDLQEGSHIYDHHSISIVTRAQFRCLATSMYLQSLQPPRGTWPSFMTFPGILTSEVNGRSWLHNDCIGSLNVPNKKRL